MEPAQIIDNLKNALAEVKDKGQNTVAINALETYLETLRSNANKSIELQKIETQRTLAQLDAQTKHSIEMFKAVIDSGREALHALVLVNGGAVVALLGFMGAILTKGLPQSLGLNLSIPLLLFGLGVLLGAIGFATRYFSQAYYANSNKKMGDRFRIAAISVAITGYVLFGSGLYGAYRALSTQFST